MRGQFQDQGGLFFYIDPEARIPVKHPLREVRAPLSNEHFSVDGTLIEAWASHKSFRPKDGSDDGPNGSNGDNFRGQKRKNDTHESTSDPDSRLFRKAKGRQGARGKALLHGPCID